MKSWILITDFDNTMSKKDFYHIIIDDYIGEEARAIYKDHKVKGGLIGTEFLNKIFSWQRFSEQERKEILSKVEIDKDTKTLIETVKNANGDLLVLSAGFDYYIQETFKRKGISNIPIITNPGAFVDGTFVMKPDKEAYYYSKVYGVDKGKVLEHYKTLYDFVIFIGDSEPDYHGAIHADVVFAKDELAKLMTDNNKPHYKIQSYKEVIELLPKVMETHMK